MAVEWATGASGHWDRWASDRSDLHGGRYFRWVTACTSCGRANADDARFCSGCGGRLADASSTEARKIVTVVFADLADSTALGERLDPESVRTIIARYFDIARAAMERHGGSVEKFIGDAVMAVFGVPAVHEDDALRAVRAAAELQSRMTGLDEELVREYGVTLRLRIGINTGEVVVGTAERLATGDPVNVAARFQAAAGPGEVLLGAATYRLARNAVDAEPVGPLTLKGKSEPVPAFRLLDVDSGAALLHRRWDGPFLGRATQLDRLRGGFEEAVRTSQCRIAMLVGAPGIGKSRLAQQFVSAQPGGARVLGGRCLPYGEGMTFWPLREIFAAAGALDEFEAALAASSSEDTFWQVRKALEAQARQQPLVLVVDDVHWAEPMLLDMLEHLVEWTRNAPILVLCTARPEFVDLRPRWAGEPKTDVLVLDPLAADDVDELIDILLGDSSDAAVRARVREAAAGNPLFVEQLAAALLEGVAGDDVPVTVQALLAARLETLSSDERDVLERASVVGLEFAWDELTQLSEDGSRPPGSVLSSLIRKQLISRHELADEMFVFDHMLIRDAAYEQISKSRRADLHERLARWLDTHGAEFAEIVGYHFEQAHACLVGLGRHGQRAEALAREAASQLAASGMRASARGDSTAAATLLRRAVALLSSDPSRRAELQLPLAIALRDIGRIEEAEQVLIEAVEFVDADELPAAAADLRIVLAEIQFHRYVVSGVNREDVLRVVNAGIAVFEEAADDARLGRALCLVGKLRFWKGETDESLPFLERSVVHARRAGDDRQEASTLLCLANALFHGPTPLAIAVDRIREIGQEKATNFSLMVVAASLAGMLECHRGRFDVGQQMIGEAVAVTEERGLAFLRTTTALMAKGSGELLARNALAAEATLHEACQGAEELGERGYLASIAPLYVDALVALGRLDEALEFSDRWRPGNLTVPEDADAHLSGNRSRALALLHAGSISDAERHARIAVTIGAATDYLAAYADSCRVLGEVLRAAGREAEAVEAFREAASTFERKGLTVLTERTRAALMRESLH